MSNVSGPKPIYEALTGARQVASPDYRDILDDATLLASMIVGA